jgi:hypothetical protein
MKNRYHIFRTIAITWTSMALLLAMRALGQAPPPKGQSSPNAATLHVTTRVVQVSVIAQDGDGHQVTGLTQDDFKVLDNGVAQKIVSFAQHSSRFTADVTPGVRPISANTFSNRVDDTTRVPPSVIVILLAALNSDFHDMASARAQVIKFLRQLHPEDRVVLYELTTKLIVLHDFTSDTATLPHALGAAPNPQSGAPDTPPQITAATEAEILDTMQMLAQGTVGVAFYNTNDLGGAIRRAIDDSSLTYELTYYPTNEKWDGRFRDIKVEVNRPGVHLRYRKGYFATPTSPSTSESQAKLMTAVAQDPLEATQLGLTVQISAVAAPGPRQAKVEVRVDPDLLHFDLNAGKWNDNVEIAWVELDAGGNDVGHSAKSLTLNYPEEEHNQVLREGLVFKSTIQMADTCVGVRLVARGSGTGAIGSVNIPLTGIFTNASIAGPKN